MSTATPTAAVHLPTLQERPDADIVVYDGHCRFCRAQVERLVWWDCQHKLAFVSLHDPEVARRFPDLTHDDLMREMYIIEPSGVRHRGAGAIRYLSRRLRRLWWLAPILHIPLTLPLWQWLYQLVANRRYRFGKLEECDGGTCHLHGRGGKSL